MTGETWYGAMAFVVIAAVAMTAPAAPLLLMLFRRSVTRAMRARSAGILPAVPPASQPAPHPTPIRIELIPGTATPHSALARTLFARIQRAHLASAVVYALGGIVFASILALATVRETGDWANAKQFFYVFTAWIWPAVIVLFAVSTASARVKAIGLPIAAAILLAVHVAIGRSPVWLWWVGVPTVVLLIVGNRWLKTLAPFVALFAFLIVFALNAGLEVLRLRLDGSPLGFDEAGAITAVAFIVTFLAGLVALLSLARWYRRKRFSDRSFLLGFLWTTFASWYVLAHGMAFWWAAPIALAAYAIVTGIGLRFLRNDAKRHYSANLLVLRVFGSASHGQRLFEELGLRWRYAGPIHLIAGTDSVAANLDPDEALRYLTLRFRSLYVHDMQDLGERLEHLDTAPDPDGRYRINDFFCIEDTWKTTFLHLLERSHAVLVDLRGFGEKNKGVAFEIGRLFAKRPLDTFVIVVDEDTPLLREALTQAWSSMPDSSPNATLADPVLRILQRPRADALVAALCDAAVAARWQPAPLR